ncbi:hypothetical protein MMIN_15370 [Mycolicibacter minnesotensis]|nr:hypothetical protein MMIN_15370 [Mycolicibacter minnesotensis]
MVLMVVSVPRARREALTVVPVAMVAMVVTPVPVARVASLVAALRPPVEPMVRLVPVAMVVLVASGTTRPLMAARRRVLLVAMVAPAVTPVRVGLKSAVAMPLTVRPAWAAMVVPARTVPRVRTAPPWVWTVAMAVLVARAVTAV